MRIRVRVTALVEWSPWARRASEFVCSYQSRTQSNIPNPSWGLKDHLDSARGDDVVHRLSGGPNLDAIAQPMNNVGKAIRIRKNERSKRVPGGFSCAVGSELSRGEQNRTLFVVSKTGQQSC